MKQFKRAQIEPQTVTICGEEYPALFSLSAMADIEEQTGVPYTVLFTRMAEQQGTVKDQITIIWACLRAGGTEVDIEDLTASLDINELANALIQIMGLIDTQTPDGDGEAKNLQ